MKPAPARAACIGRSRPFTVVIRSTVPPGTNALVRERVLAAATVDGATPTIHFASNPEFMREGSSIRDFDHPPFVLIGSDHPDASWALRELYAGVNAQVVDTTIRTAEMIKYVCNAYHALKLAHRGYVMVTGNITMSGTGKELIENPQVRAAYLEGGH